MDTLSNLSSGRTNLHESLGDGGTPLLIRAMTTKMITGHRTSRSKKI